MPAKFHPSQVVRHISGVRYASQAAVKHAPQTTSSLPKREPRITTLPNGCVVASVENYSPISRVSIAFKAGSRFETAENLGVTHALRNTINLGTEKHSIVGITRNIQQIGGNLTATSSREHIIYNLECNRDNAEQGIDFLKEAAIKPAFKAWEISDNEHRIKWDLALLNEQPHIYVLEQLHKAAYRTGLKNSLYIPKHRIGDHDPEVLLDFVKTHFLGNRSAVVGVGICHDYLVEYATKHIKLPGGEVPHVTTKYGGGEVHVDTHHPLSYVAVATEGASTKNPKEALALAVFQQVMGVGSNIKWCNGAGSQKLSQIAAKATDKPFAITALNLNYSDSGLFGFYLVSQPEDTSKILKSVFTSYSAITKSGIPDAEIQKAKHQLKAALGFAQECNTSLVEELAVQALTHGGYTQLKEIYEIIDGLSANDVNTAAKKVINGKPSLAAVGNLQNTPHLDGLL